MADVRPVQARAYWHASHPEGSLSTQTLQIDRVAAFPDEPVDCTSPEELLTAAAASCYLLTLRTLFEHRSLPVQRIELTTEARVEVDGGLRMDAIVHRPVIVLEEPADEARVRLLAAHAEHACMVSSALRGNVVVTVEPTVCVASGTSA
ncbi:MAG: OsmC family protein [Alicyclobacillus sp.]|nr:OsmC family protein [Alicyclobacillus sp.]